MAGDSEQKPTQRKRAPKKPAPVIIEQALGDLFWAGINEVRRQLRAGETLALPSMLERTLPLEPSAGDKVKVMDWRAWIVWAEWTGKEWDLIVFQDGKPLK